MRQDTFRAKDGLRTAQVLQRILKVGLVVGEDPVLDGKWFRVTDSGVTLITQDMLNRRALSL